MKRIFVLLLFSWIATNVSAQEIAGQWMGILKLPATDLKLVFNVIHSGGKYRATFDSPNQGAKNIPIETTCYENGELIFHMPQIRAEYLGRLNEQGGVEGIFRQSGQEFPMAVMITGSGPQNRDEEMMGHKPFWIIADYLARRGIGVLRFDDRGVGKSTGVFDKATSLDFARDAASAVRYLKEKRKFREIGLIGHSEGGMIAPLVASESKDVKFIVLLAGTGIRGDQVLLTQQTAINREAGIADTVVQEIERWNRGIYDIILASSSVDEVRDSVSTYFRNLLEAAPPGAIGGIKSEDIIRARVDQLLNPWMYFFMRYDPVLALKKVKCPVLALNGDKDLQVLPEINLNGIRRGLVAAKNRNVTIKVLPGLNHLFQECESGNPALYGSISQTFSPVALKEIGDWIENLKIKK